jgi:hypothetical protein
LSSSTFCHPCHLVIQSVTLQYYDMNTLVEPNVRKQSLINLQTRRFRDAEDLSTERSSFIGDGN